LLFWIATLLVFAGGMLVWSQARRREAARIETDFSHEPNPQPIDRSLPKLTEFVLMDQTGKRFDSRELNGQVWAGSFFFTACPGTCYNQNIKLQQLLAKYAERGLHLVSITCDPGNDTPEALARYASRFQADPRTWMFLTPTEGGMDYLRRIANDFFGVAIGPATHTDRVVLFDRQGTMVGAYSVLNVEQYRELDRQIEQALAATAPPSEAAQPTETSAEAPETSATLHPRPPIVARN
jgi:protein SCO1/2